ncbi:hypothetical protein AYM40_20880 [Paraburkholderia phytofirmans OLGA172]|uniref:Transposase n=1 Tax=Paraburkholderia phytofirmans OLGA172 TaxID=1417228 RepID=A0A160FQY6_9BURK|nr:hypothetical protein AYM40_20880 [Paraburkholderia phytofirmans OLGA172]
MGRTEAYRRLLTSTAAASDHESVCDVRQKTRRSVKRQLDTQESTTPVFGKRRLTTFDALSPA